MAFWKLFFKLGKRKIIGVAVSGTLMNDYVVVITFYITYFDTEKCSILLPMLSVTALGK